MNCSKSIYDGSYQGHRCSRRAVHYEQGQNWCRQHTPSLVAFRQAERNAKVSAQVDNRIAAADRANQRRHLTNSILKRLAAIETEGWHPSVLVKLVADAKEVLKGVD